MKQNIKFIAFGIFTLLLTYGAGLSALRHDALYTIILGIGAFACLAQVAADDCDDSHS